MDCSQLHRWGQLHQWYGLRLSGSVCPCCHTLQRGGYCSEDDNLWYCAGCWFWWTAWHRARIQENGGSGGLETKAAKRRSRKRAVEQQHGGPDPTKVSENSARAERRVRSLLRWVHGGAEEDSHITQRNID